MILSDVDIIRELQAGNIGIDGLKDKQQIQPASVDLRLGNEFIAIEPENARAITGIDISQSLESQHFIHKKINIADGGKIRIKPYGFMLGTTIESVSIPDTYTAFLEGRSSVGRSAVFIHNAGYIDPGFEGQITLELFNALPYTICIPVGIRICQMVISKLQSKCKESYSKKGKYQYQSGATVSGLYKDKF